MMTCQFELVKLFQPAVDAITVGVSSKDGEVSWVVVTVDPGVERASDVIGAVVGNRMVGMEERSFAPVCVAVGEGAAAGDSLDGEAGVSACNRGEPA